MNSSARSINPLAARKGVRGLTTAWVMVACAWLLIFAMYAALLCIPPLAHIMHEKLRVSHAAVGFLFSLPFTMLIVVGIPGGFLGDRFGTRKIIGIGALVMTVGSLLRATSQSFATLLTFSVLYGIGFGIIYPNLPKLVGLWFPREKVGLATGVYSTGMTTGGAIALAITLPLIYPLTNSIQGTFLIWSIPAIGASVLWWIVAKDPPSLPIPADSAAITSAPLPSYSLWKDRNMWLIALVIFFNNIHFFTWSAWSPALLMSKGASPELAAFIASFRGWGGFPAIFFMPWASYKVGLRRPFLWGSALLLAFLSLSAIYIPVTLGWPLMTLVGVVTSGTFPIMLALTLELLPRQYAGVATGTVLSISYVGGLIGPWLTGLILDVTGSLEPALLMLTGTAIAWAIIVFLIPETGPKGTSQSPR
jgi:cyanate permease